MKHLQRAKKWSNAAKVLTVLAVVSLLAGVHAGLEWAEAETSPEVMDRHDLHVEFEAPARFDLGPWEEGHRFHGGSVGIPLDLAPLWWIKATHERASSAQEGEWRAQMEMRMAGSGGRDWWSTQSDQDLVVEGKRAYLEVNMRDLVDEARRLSREAGVPGDLQIEITIEHTTQVATQHGEATSKRTARILVEPRSDFVTVQTHDDKATFHRTVAKDPPWTAAVVTVVAATFGASALYARSRHPKGALEKAVIVERLVVPDDAVVTDPESFAHLARQSGKQVLYAPKTGTLLLTDTPCVIARIHLEKDSESNDEAT